MNYLSEKQVFDILDRQKVICQEGEGKRFHIDSRGCFIHVEDIADVDYPNLPIPAISGSFKGDKTGK